MDGHHLGVHGQRSVGVVAAAGATFEGREVGLGLLLLRFLLLLLQLLLQLGDGWAVQAAVGDTTVLEGAAVEARAVVIVALTDDLTAADDDTTMAVVERRVGAVSYTHLTLPTKRIV